MIDVFYLLCFSYFVIYLIEKTIILSFWDNFLHYLEIKNNWLYYLSFPLGRCIICFSTWVLIINFLIVLFFVEGLPKYGLIPKIIVLFKEIVLNYFLIKSLNYFKYVIDKKTTK